MTGRILWLGLAVLLVAPSAALPQTKTRSETTDVLFVIREQTRPLLGGPKCSAGVFATPLSHWELDVFKDRSAREETWTDPACSNVPASWTRPASGSKERRFVIPRDRFEYLEGLLELPKVKELRDFLGDTFGVGDYQIEIHRRSGVQKIPVFGLMPQHYELKQDPSLLRVICVAKEIAGGEYPGWCTERVLTKP